MPQISYTPRQAADETGISEDTIRAAIRSGDIALAKLEVNGREVKRQIIMHDDLLAWLRGAS